jgi:methionyl-tRNA formyltransferase
VRVILVTQGITPMVKAFFASRHDVVGVIEGAPRKAPPKTPDTPTTLAGFAGRRRIPYFWLHRESGPELATWVKARRPALGVIYSLSQLLSQAVIDLFPAGMINLHPSLLPAYRGPNPYFWASLDEADSVGVTIHYIDAGEDTGDIISQFRVPNTPGLTYDQCVRTTLVEGTRLLLEAADAIEDGTALRVSQPEGSPTRRARRVRSERVLETIDWGDWPIDRVWRFVCGAAPWLQIPTAKGAAVTLDQFRVRGYRAAPHAAETRVRVEGYPLPFCRLRHPSGDVLLMPNLRYWKRRLQALVGR